MAKWGSVDFRQFERFAKKFEQMQKAEFEKFCEACAKEIAARMLAKVIKRTPVGIYDKPVNFTTAGGKVVSFTPKTGKMGGTLRRGWTARKHSEAEAGGKANVSAFAQSLRVSKRGKNYHIELINPVKYASYVEYGHRTSNGKGWVKGRYMMTISADEVQQQAPKVIEKKLMKFLGEVFDGN